VAYVPTNQIRSVSASDGALRGDGDHANDVTLQSLETQRGLLPYALAVFAVGCALFIWVGSHAANAPWIVGTLVIFAINWAMFYAVVNTLSRPGYLRDDIAAGLRIHILCGLLWAAAIAQIAGFALFAGPMMPTLLMLALGAAATCCFFSATSLPCLLIVAPTASAVPLLVMATQAQTQALTPIALGGTALAMALSLILNRLLRRQFDLAAEREVLMQERAQSLDAARLLAKSKSDIVATLSHEIRNGLTGVTHVLAAATGASGRSQPSREQMNAALGAARDLIEVLNATLDSETAEQGRLAIDLAPINAARLAEDLVLLNRPAAAAKGLELALHIENGQDSSSADASGAVIGDLVRTRQIIANLISNAIKYTVRGRIEVRLRQTEANMARIEVADTGPGLTADEIDRAFEPFARIDRTGAGTSGAGLGLSLSRQLARLMGGDTAGSSALGVGSCFWVDLPFDPEARIASPQPETSDYGTPPVAPVASYGTVKARRTPLPTDRPLRILMAEDDGLAAAMLRSILEKLGHKVVHAQNGRRAVDLVKGADFDLLMLDAFMPVLGGADAAREIRSEIGGAASIPIIALIDGEADDARECLDAGMDGALRKPATVVSVAHALAAVASADKTDLRSAA
jgi:signal transduction histidine kinase/ActR/RegA family two-component response regulator